MKACHPRPMSVRTIIKDEVGASWIDLTNPSPEELRGIAHQFGLHPSSVEDCLDPTHLPKAERIGDTWFFILRVFDEHSGLQADTVQELTRKVAIFWGPQFLLTIHRAELSFIEAVAQSVTKLYLHTPENVTPPQGGLLPDSLPKTNIEVGDKSANSHPISSKRTIAVQQVFFEIISHGLNTYHRPLDQDMDLLAQMESQTFLHLSSNTQLIQSAYYLKSRVFIIKRMVRMISDNWSKLIVTSSEASPWLQEIKDTADDILFYCEDLIETTHQLMNLHISLQSHRTNEVMRILTVFSVIFMPLNLITGIYGMNFEFMPELKTPYGYPLALMVMALIAGTVAVWIVKRGWLGDR